MVAFIYFVLAVLVHADLPAGQYFDCTASAYRTEAACVATKYCMWNSLSTVEAQSCVYDPCLKYVAVVDDADATNCTGTTGCGLYYITDVHNCTNGEVVEQTDLFCRTDNKVNVGYHKLSIDECFYQDLKSKATGGAGLCSNIGSTSCGRVGSGNTSYCDATGTQTCNLYLEDNDLTGFCGCLGADRCNLYPGCAIKVSGGACVEDPCFYATPGVAGCAGVGIPNLDKCGVKNIQKINLAGALEAATICVTASESTVKVNDYNPCYYGISASISYPAWATTDETKYPECAIVNEVNKCESIIYSGEKTCTVKDIASGYFLGAQGHYCTDDKDRKIPSPDSGSILRIPSILLLVLIAIVALL